MSDNFEVNPAVVEAMEFLQTTLPAPMTNGYFNRYMFLEAVSHLAGPGAAIEANDIMQYACMTEKEFEKLSEEYIAKGVIKAEKNMFGIIMYSLCL